jgi:hypothetical protein
MHSIHLAHIATTVHLFISCEYDASPEVLTFARNIKWSHGHFEVLEQAEKLGVDQHNLTCMRLAELYGNILVLEDDLVVAPGFVDYILAAHSLLAQTEVAGLSLYRYPMIEADHFPFNLIPNEEFLYYQQRPSSKGCFYTWDSVRPYFQFLETFNFDFAAYNLPANVLKWENAVWEKSFYCYLIESSRYLAFPRYSLSTDFADKGVHMKKQVNKYAHQSPLYLSRRFETMASLACTLNVYDAFYELEASSIKALNPTLKDYDFEMDIYGHKPLFFIKTPFIISVKKSKDLILGWERRLKPETNNIILNQYGHFYVLAHTRSFDASVPQKTNLEEKFLYYFPNTKLTTLLKMKWREVISRFY